MRAVNSLGLVLQSTHCVTRLGQDTDAALQLYYLQGVTNDGKQTGKGRNDGTWNNPKRPLAN